MTTHSFSNIYLNRALGNRGAENRWRKNKANLILNMHMVSSVFIGQAAWILNISFVEFYPKLSNIL